MPYDAEKLRTFIRSELVDKELVHKVDERNVFIRDLRRALPKFIPEDVFMANISSAAPADAELLRSFYRPCPPGLAEILGGAGARGLVLRTLPAELPASILERPPTPSADVERSIRAAYVPGPDPALLVPARPLADEHYFHIINHLRTPGIYIPRKQEARLSCILEGWQGLAREDVFYASIYVNPEHEYYFEHAVEHIPAMMLIEAQRQFGLACCHVYGRIPVHGMQIILKNLEIEFLNYAELVYPVTIRGTVTESRWRKGQHWSDLSMDIGFYQDGLVARFRFVGKSVDSKLFERFRERKLAAMRKRRFAPHSFIDYCFQVKSTLTREYRAARLRDLSLSGFGAIFDSVPDEREGQDFSFFIHTDMTGVISGACKMVWSNPAAGTAGFSFVDLSGEDTRRLNDFIGKYAYSIEERDYHPGSAQNGN